MAAIGDDPQAAGLRALPLTSKAPVLEVMDQPRAAMAAARPALVLAERAGTHRNAAARVAVAQKHDRSGERDDALAELEVAAGLAGQSFLPAIIHGLTALIAGHRDDRETMTAHLEAVAGIPVSPDTAEDAKYLRKARTLAAEHAGNLTMAADLLARCLEPATAEHMPARYLVLPTTRPRPSA